MSSTKQCHNAASQNVFNLKLRQSITYTDHSNIVIGRKGACLEGGKQRWQDSVNWRHGGKREFGLRGNHPVNPVRHTHNSNPLKKCSSKSCHTCMHLDKILLNLGQPVCGMPHKTQHHNRPFSAVVHKSAP